MVSLRTKVSARGSQIFALLPFALLAVVSIQPALGSGMALVSPGGDGFTLSTFTYGFENDGAVGPVGIGFTSDGKVMVSDYASGNVRVFSDIDGQNASLVTPASPQTNEVPGIAGLANLNGTVYMVNQSTGELFQMNNDGTVNHLVLNGLGSATGLTAANGLLYISNVYDGNIFSVDPTAASPAATVFKSGYAIDGVSAAGGVLYGTDVSQQHVFGFDLGTGNVVFDSGFISGADGSAAGTGSLAGNVFVNTNYGQVWEVNAVTSVQTLIADSGSRGDLVAVDPNGTLLLTQTDSVIRLSAPEGGGFGADTQEPGTIGMMLSGLAVAFGLRRRTIG